MGIEENLVLGKILHLYVRFPHQEESQNKYLVFVGIDSYSWPLLLKLNTEGNQPQVAQKFREKQFKIKKSIYPCLDHDRFLDCGTVWYRLLTMDEIIRQVSKDNNRLGNDIINDHLREIVRLTNLSRSIENRHKKIIEDSVNKKLSHA